MKKDSVYRSPLFYVGDKYKLITEIHSHFPKHIHRLVEPFVGGGSVFMNIPADEYYLNDIDSSIVSLHKFLIRNSKNADKFLQRITNTAIHYGLSRSVVEDVVPDDLKKQFVKTYYARFNKRGYEQMRSEYNAADKRDEFLLYMLLIYGFNHMIRFNKNGDFNLPVGNVDFNPNVEKALRDYFELVQEKEIKWYNKDFEAFISKLDLCDEDLVYLDPPYLITFSEYNKMWDKDTERRLLKLLDSLNERGIKFALSNVINYKGRVNELLLEWSNTGKYHIHPIQSNYISYHDNSINSFNDVLITNFIPNGK